MPAGTYIKLLTCRLGFLNKDILSYLFIFIYLFIYLFIYYFLIGLTSAAQSIFKYDNGKSHSDYSFPTFVPKFLDEANETLVAEATSLCGEGKNQCIFDYVFTGNSDLALATTATEDQASENNADAGMCF
jgi:hypothetical protein